MRTLSLAALTVRELSGNDADEQRLAAAPAAVWRSWQRSRRRLPYFQFCDAPAKRPTDEAELLRQARPDRLPPGEGGLELAGLLRTLSAAVPISLEVPLSRPLPALERARSGARSDTVSPAANGNRSPGGPSDFSYTLNGNAPIHSARRLRQAKDHCSRRMRPLRAFIVEDSPVIRENLVAALEELVPLQVVGSAEDEAGAVRWLSNAANECDIAIVDIFLRDGSGMGVLRALRETPQAPERVVLTNYASSDLRRQCLALGASRVFDKSGDIEALVEHCATLAARR